MRPGGSAFRPRWALWKATALPRGAGATPPVGSKRWKRPRPHRGWGQQVLAATRPGPACEQDPPLEEEAHSEDCLRLHVWTVDPAPSAPAPVIVLFHDGFLAHGSAMHAWPRPPLLPGTVSITVNYRLGTLGFLALETLSVESPRGVSGNYGLLDCIAALRFIQRNAAAFGGDSRRVTVYGHRSGGSLVLALLASPLAKGLFQRAVALSPSPRLNATLPEAQWHWHPTILNRTTCRDVGKGALDRLRECLRGLPAPVLARAAPSHDDPTSRLDHVAAPRLVIDGYAIAEDYLTAFSSGGAGTAGEAVPTLLGAGGPGAWGGPEPGASVEARDPWAALASVHGPSLAAAVVAAYGPKIPFDTVVEDATRVCPALYLASAMALGWRAPLYVVGGPVGVNASIMTEFAASGTIAGWRDRFSEERRYDTPYYVHVNGTAMKNWKSSLCRVWHAHYPTFARAD